MVSVPTLSRTAVDRAAGKRDDEAWLAAAWETGRLLVLDSEGRVRIDDDGPSLVFAESASKSADGDQLLLGVDEDGIAFWGAVGDPPNKLGTRLAGLREVGAALGDRDAGLFVTLIALSNWHATHTHCPQCGTPTVTVAAGHAQRCPADGSEHFPRVDPAVIMLVTDPDDRCLLARNRRWPERRVSILAGFVEPGESAEQAVAREVGEETGITVARVRYVGSQPWPMPQSLMLGFRADAGPGQEITVDDE